MLAHAEKYYLQDQEQDDLLLYERAACCLCRDAARSPGRGWFTAIRAWWRCGSPSAPAVPVSELATGCRPRRVHVAAAPLVPGRRAAGHAAATARSQCTPRCMCDWLTGPAAQRLKRHRTPAKRSSTLACTVVVHHKFRGQKSDSVNITVYHHARDEPFDFEHG